MAAFAVPPVPGTPDDRAAAMAGAEPEGLLGPGGAPGADPAGEPAKDPNEMLRAVMARFRQIMADVDAIASMFPEAGAAARQVKNALAQMMNAAISRPHGMGTEGPAPRLLG